MHNNIAIYHSADLDGICSGAIAKFALAGEVELIGYDYGEEFPWDRITPEHTVYMMDVSLGSAEDMQRMKNSCKEFIWIDHHQSAILMVEEAGLELNGVQGLGKSGCELTWDWFFFIQRYDRPPAKYENMDPPRAVTLLGRYDVWDHSDPETLPFQFAMRAEVSGVNDPIWTKFFSKLWGYKELYIPIIEKGEAILEHIRSENNKYASICAFQAQMNFFVEDEWIVLKCIAINRALTNSQMFDSVWDPEKYEAMVTFYLNNRGQWRVSLYTDRDDIDVSVLAKSKGGGGHKKAAGFISDTMPLERHNRGPSA